MTRVRRARREWLTGLAFVSPWLVGFCLFLLLPAAMSLAYSLTDYSMIEPPVGVGLDNYQRLLNDPVFWKVMGNTSLYALAVITIGTVAALAIAGLLDVPRRWSVVARAAILLPAVAPTVAAAMVWMWMLNGELGLVNRALAALGIDGPNWLSSSRWIMPSMILIGLWTIGQQVVIYLAALRDVPGDLREAAALDGMSHATRFVHVTLPMISPIVLFNVITGVIGAWQVFAIPYILLGPGGGPNRSGYFYTTYLYEAAFSHLDMGYASALAWVQMLIVLALTGLTFVVSRRAVFYRMSE